VFKYKIQFHRGPLWKNRGPQRMQYVFLCATLFSPWLSVAVFYCDYNPFIVPKRYLKSKSQQMQLVDLVNAQY
jgi:hypothetical protein